MLTQKQLTEYLQIRIMKLNRVPEISKKNLRIISDSHSIRILGDIEGRTTPDVFSMYSPISEPSKWYITQPVMLEVKDFETLYYCLVEWAFNRPLKY